MRVRALGDNALGTKLDDKAIRAKAEEMGKLEGEQAVMNAKRDKDMRKVLPKERYDAMYGAPAGADRFRRPAGSTNPVPPVIRTRPML